MIKRILTPFLLTLALLVPAFAQAPSGPQQWVYTHNQAFAEGPSIPVVDNIELWHMNASTGALVDQNQSFPTGGYSNTWTVYDGSEGSLATWTTSTNSCLFVATNNNTNTLTYVTAYRIDMSTGLLTMLGTYPASKGPYGANIVIAAYKGYVYAATGNSESGGSDDLYSFAVNSNCSLSWKSTTTWTTGRASLFFNMAPGSVGGVDYLLLPDDFAANDVVNLFNITNGATTLLQSVPEFTYSSSGIVYDACNSNWYIAFAPSGGKIKIEQLTVAGGALTTPTLFTSQNSYGTVLGAFFSNSQTSPYLFVNYAANNYRLVGFPMVNGTPIVSSATDISLGTTFRVEGMMTESSTSSFLVLPQSPLQAGDNEALNVFLKPEAAILGSPFGSYVTFPQSNGGVDSIAVPASVCTVTN